MDLEVQIEEAELGNSNFPPKPVVGGNEFREAGQEEGLGLSQTDSTINGAVESQLESRAGNDSSTADSTTSLITVDDESSSDTPLPDAQPNFKRTASELSSSEAEEAVEKKGRGEVDLHEPLVEQVEPPSSSSLDQCSFLNIALQSTPLEQRANFGFGRTGSLTSPPDCKEIIR
ncbi:uncharacterized protein V6R79_003232 [Siganus canaliculatus]